MGRQTVARGVRQIATLLLAVCLASRSAAAQAEVSAGLLVVPDASVGGTQFGPAISLAATTHLGGFPLVLEVGGARTDFASLGQEFHDNHFHFGVATEWFLMQGKSRLGLRLGAAAYRESQIVETNPTSGGGVNWNEALVAGFVLARDLEAGSQLVLALSDFVLGPVFAVFDSEEYGIEHRVQLTLGVRF